MATQDPQPNRAPQNQRGRRYNARNANRARQDIRPDVPPVQLDAKFLGFTAPVRGNAKVELNHGFTEIVANDFRGTIKVYQESKGFFDRNAQPLDLEYLTRGLAGGLCLSTASKLIQATPASELPQIATFQSFKEFQLSVPRSFLTIIDLIGKIDYRDWVIRIKDNPGSIKRFILKAIRYFKANDDFNEEFVLLTDDEQAKFDNLDNIPLNKFDEIFFDDKGSVEKIHSLAETLLEKKMANSFTVKVGENQVYFGYPPLPTMHTKQAIIEWLGELDGQVHPHAENIGRVGVLLLVDLDWLEHPDTELQRLDTTFRDSVVGELTPIQLLNASGLHHYTEFLSKQRFIEFGRSCYTYYASTITQRLKSIFHLVNQGISSLGSPAQLGFTPEDSTADKTDPGIPDYHGLPRIELDRNLNHFLSYVMLDIDIADKVTKSAMVKLVKHVAVESDPDYYYECHLTNALTSIRRAYFSHDGLVFSQQRMYN
ncbi:9655_t:CDS:1 [Paraglomus brasilianum]|uniref:9655_t:CDS:1 n=1 Tax=Paraglomus brasilianum TaxID=144538 RepID=A0A9N9DS02_9GLOM|nr:9655_t:CDS:1 [Paraglomus brasilianum]